MIISIIKRFCKGAWALLCLVWMAVDVAYNEDDGTAGEADAIGLTPDEFKKLRKKGLL